MMKHRELISEKIMMLYFIQEEKYFSRKINQHMLNFISIQVFLTGAKLSHLLLVMRSRILCRTMPIENKTCLW